ncbi:hypothetical protein HA387_10410 [Clavibacter michiganensis subsp. michiganensis]|uniref:HEPN domain-containing protein n=1 Tax=Clavibacter michiganensis TaxID=28447 RepID=UPI0018674A2B|nr:HEPN domain-containing protein [Clavibacter michiganensis]MBE3078829.1 hypothetical protein [Clavibacter michiganensis subsp. michiganensis]
MSYSTKVLHSELAHFDEFMSLVKAEPALETFLNWNPSDDKRWLEHVFEIQVADLPLQMAERHIAVKGFRADSNLLCELGIALLSWWQNEELDIEIMIPILNVNFEASGFELSANKARVEKLSADMQLARWPGHPTVNAYADIIMMSTHAVVIRGWSLVNESAGSWLRAPDGPPADVPEVPLFFQALRATSDAPTGYVQVMYRPIGWAHRYRGSLPVIEHGPLVDMASKLLQPNIEPVGFLNKSRVETLQAYYSSLEQTGGSIAIAAQRLFESELRERDADRILDLCIGIEALVAGNPGDATYKIMIRSAAVLARRGLGPASEVMRAAKTIYAYRSSVVHGRGKSQRSENLTLDGQRLSAVDGARLILRELLRARLEDPDIDSDRIDVDIIARALDSWLDQPQEEATGVRRGAKSGSAQTNQTTTD